jgi:oligopeptide transport system substrate-binding protein
LVLYEINSSTTMTDREIRGDLEMKKVLSIALAAVMVASVFAGCKSSQNTGTTNGLKPIKACVGSEPKSIDPAINQAVDGSIYLVHAFEGLTKADKDNKTVAGTAESWDISKDGLIYTFHIRKDAKWSDGKSVTAGDFVYAWQRAVNPLTASPYSYQLNYITNAEAITSQYVDKNGKPAKVKVDKAGKPVKDAKGNYTEDPNGAYVSAKKDGSAIWLDDLGAKATDDYTLVVTLVSPCTYFLQIAGFPTLDPVRKDIIEKNPDKWATDPATYIGNGPYMLKTWNHNSKMVFVANPNYYDKKNIVGSELDFLLMNDTNSILAAFKNGQLDLAEDYPTDELATLVKNNEAKIYSNLGIYYYAFNDKVAPFDNINVRKALTLAIDRDYLVNSVAKGGQKPAGSIVPYGILDADGKTDFRENGKEPFDVSSAGNAANIAEAKKALAEAGYPDGKGFPTITIKYNTSEIHQKPAEFVQSEWKKNLGINVNIVNEEWSVFINDRNTGNYQVARDGWNADYADPMTFLDIFVSNSGNNDSKFSNAEFDKLISGAKKESDATKRMTELHQAEKILTDNYACMPIYYYTNPDLVSSKLQGYVSSSMGYKYLMWASVK